MKVLQKGNSTQLKSMTFDTSKIKQIEAIERELYNTLADSKGVIREMCSHILEAGGKRLRPLLVIYSGLIFSNLTDELLQASVAAELIHMASLVHDDIIDNSGLRRSRPSINKKWGNHFAVLCGDYLFAKAFGVLAKHRLIGSMDFMVHAIKNMCHGEIQQAGDRFLYDCDISSYYERISQKTAIFLECCCKSGALIAGANDLQVKALGDYGLNLGLAFQIIDDILDFCGDPNIMGKPIGEDLRQGNITLPIILMLKDTKAGGWVREVIEKGELDEKNIGEILLALKELGIIQQSFEVAVKHIDTAKQCLELVPHCEYSDILYELTDKLQARAN